MSCIEPIRHPNAASSYLDLQPPQRKHKLSPNLTARIAALRSTLTDIHLTIETRKLLVRLERSTCLYCPLCTLLDHPGFCGHTCPLLRPRDRQQAWMTPITSQWAQVAHADRVLYRALVADMNERGSTARAATVRRWERGVEKLRVSGRSFSEKAADKNWQLVQPVDYRGGLKQRWGFGEGWGNGPVPDEEIAPEDGGRRAKRGLSVGDEYPQKRVCV